MRFLKTNTATRITVGPFLDKTDGITPETGLSVTSEKLTLMVDDAGVPTLVLDAAPTASGGNNDMVHVTGDDAGFYDLELTAANLNYVGRAMLALTDAATHCPVFHEFMILPANIYDSFVGGSDVLDVSVTQWLGTAAATPTVAGVPEVDVTHFGGTALTAASGIPEVKVNNIAANAITAAATAADFSTEVNTAVLAVLGALNDAAADGAVTTTDTMVAYLKQIINTLEGAPGIPTWPAAAAPGNAVSIAEAVRYIYDQIGVAGAGLTAADDATITAIAGLDTKLDTIDNFIDTEIATLITMLTGIVPVNGTIGATGNSTTALHLSGIAWADNGPNSMLLTIKDVSTGLFYSRWIEDWTDVGDLATVATLPFTPEASVDLYWLTPVRADVTGGAGLDAAGVRAAIGLASANLDTQLTAIDDYLDTEVSAIKTVTDAIGATGTGLSAIPWNASWDAEVQSEVADALAVYDPPTRTEATSDKDEVLTRLGTPAGASISADILTIDNLVDDLESRLGTPSDLGSGATVAANLVDIEGQTDDIGVAGAGLTALATAAELAKVPKSDSNVSWNATALAAIQTEANDAIVANRLDELLAADSDIDGAQPPTVGSVYHELMSKTAGSFTFDQTTDSLEAVRDKLTDIETDTAEIGAAGAGLTAADDATLAAIAALNNLSSAQAQTAAAAALTAYDPPTRTEATSDKDEVLAKLPTALVGGRIDASVGAMAANVLTAAATHSDFGTEVATAVWASATRTLSALGFTLGASDLAADTIGASELAADAITEIVNAVLTTAMTESYNADGVAPTLAQAIFVTMQRLTEFATAGTTITVKKLDGSTTAYTLTLDDATSPTSSTRAT